MKVLVHKPCSTEVKYKAFDPLSFCFIQRGSKSSFFKQAKSYPMFPCKEEKVKWDEYGEIIRPEDYIIPETTLPEEEKKVKAVSCL